jgi:large subunit ribosomal protein L6
MSKIGKKPITIPEGVKINIENDIVKVSGPKGNLEYQLVLHCDIEFVDDKIIIKSTKQDKNSKSMYGLTRSLIKNMVVGVSEGFEKELEMVGVGYRAEPNGKDLILKVGFSHPVQVKCPDEIEFKVEKNKIKVIGIDKQLVGQVAAKIRAIRKPEPYKGKGIKYSDEIIRRKPGKAIAKTEGGK